MSETPNLDRYVRQMRFAPIGKDGQSRIAKGRVLVCGCGALGSVIANTLARAGVGHLRIVDRDLRREILRAHAKIHVAHAALADAARDLVAAQAEADERIGLVVRPRRCAATMHRLQKFIGAVVR